MLSIWLHDIGHYPLPTEIDHAIRSENIAREFLKKESVNEEEIQKILHCIRAHRVKDVQPQSMEAKIIACADSASHMTDIIYIDMAKNKMIKQALDKLERDFRDLSLFPRIKEQLTEVYESWKKLLNSLNTLEMD